RRRIGPGSADSDRRHRLGVHRLGPFGHHEGSTGMIVRTTAEITGTERDVAGEGWRSKRIVLGGDGVGFSFHETTIQAGTTHVFHYQNHIEAVWLVEGEGTLTDLDNDQVYTLGPGSMYLLNGHE